MQEFEPIDDAVRVAQQVLDGELDPNLGCGLIASIGEKNDHARELMEFVLLSHEQYGHEALGITAESCIPEIEILQACRKLVVTHAYVCVQ